MQALQDETGPIPDYGAQGKAASWLLQNYSVQDCVMVLKEILKESKANGGWRGRVSWLNVKSEIGTRLRRGKAVPVIEDRGEVFTREDAIELCASLAETDAEGFAVQIAALTTQYGLSRSEWRRDLTGEKI